jgi:hypothetical protein
MAKYESLMEANLHRDHQRRGSASHVDDARSHFTTFPAVLPAAARLICLVTLPFDIDSRCRSASGKRAIMYSELSHVELKSAEGDPYFKFPEWTPGSLQFREHQCEEKAGGTTTC